MQVITEKTGDTVSAKVWNRIYTADETPAILTSILSNETELLAEPIRLYMESNGVACSFCDAVSFRLNTEDETTLLRTFESESAIVNISQSFEEDGCDKVCLSIMPRGRSVAQVFGLEADGNAVFAPNKLYMDVRLRAVAAKYYQVYPVGDLFGSETIGDIPSLSFAGEIPSDGFYTPFKEQIYLSGDDCGLGIFFCDDRALCLENAKKAIEVIPCENGDVLLRFHLLDQLPELWEIEEGSEAEPMDLPPLTFRFGMIATPVKPFPKDGFYERSFHIDCFKKIAENYDVFLAGEVPAGSGETGYDRLKRLGVKILYIHEKWNDIQNSPQLTDETLVRAKTVVEECHRRGIKVIPYFGYELSTLSPFFAKLGDAYAVKTKPYFKGYWYRYPYQRDMIVCMGSQWTDVLYRGLTALYDICGFDGLYFDSLVMPRACTNEKHGCGYVGEDGAMHPTYAVWEIREFMKKIYAFVKEKGGTVNVHGYSACNLAAMAYCDSLWEGEVFQSLLMRGELAEMPEGLMKAQFTGRDTGVPVYALCYSNDPVWTFRNATSISLLHGSSPKPVDIAGPLEDMAKIWDALDGFPLAKAQWTPYWQPSKRLTCNNPNIKITTWETEGEILAVCANVRRDVKEEAEIVCDLPVLNDVLQECILSKNGKIQVKFMGFHYVLVHARKKGGYDERAN